MKTRAFTVIRPPRKYGEPKLPGANVRDQASTPMRQTWLNHRRPAGFRQSHDNLRSARRDRVAPRAPRLQADEEPVGKRFWISLHELASLECLDVCRVELEPLAILFAWHRISDASTFSIPEGSAVRMTWTVVAFSGKLTGKARAHGVRPHWTSRSCSDARNESDRRTRRRFWRRCVRRSPNVFFGGLSSLAAEGRYVHRAPS